MGELVKLVRPPRLKKLLKKSLDLLKARRLPLEGLCGGCVLPPLAPLPPGPAGPPGAVVRGVVGVPEELLKP